MAMTAIIYLVALQLAGTNPCSATYLEVATALDDSCSAGDNCAMSALQKVKARAPISPSCNLSRNSPELDLPISEVAAKHPNFLDDARCLYGQMYSGTACVQAHEKKNFSLYTTLTGKVKTSKQNQLFTVQYGNRTIITNRDEAVSDMMCDTMDWVGKDDSTHMSLSKGLLANFGGWRWVAGLACTDLFRKHPDMKNITFRQAVNMLNSFVPPSSSSNSWKSSATRSTLQRLVAAKCLVGEAGCQIAHCTFNVCKDKKQRNWFHHGAAQCHRIRRSILSTVSSKVAKSNALSAAAQSSWNRAWMKAARVATRRQAAAQKAWIDAWHEASTAAAEQYRQAANSSAFQDLGSYVKKYAEGVANASRALHEHMQEVNKAIELHALHQYAVNISDPQNVSRALHYHMVKAGEALQNQVEQAIALQHVTQETNDPNRD
jgi:uncharacterized protein YjhX (UPF0386 family)